MTATTVELLAIPVAREAREAREARAAKAARAARAHRAARAEAPVRPARAAHQVKEARRVRAALVRLARTRAEAAALPVGWAAKAAKFSTGRTASRHRRFRPPLTIAFTASRSTLRTTS